MKISLSPKIKSYWIDSPSYYSMQSIEKFINYFFNDININIINNSNNNYDGMIYDIQDDYEIPEKKLNIMLCVENCSYWNHYNHYNKYGNYSNNKIKIYFYNHIDKIVINENYISIPIIYLQINYLEKFYIHIQPLIYTRFEDKKFCLITTKLNNEYKKDVFNMLSSIDKCDLIQDFKHINNKSCYHDIELLNLFNQYKFVFVAENSIIDGYITEKIFNCYFSRVIPIYLGSEKSNYYFNQNTYIKINNNFEEIKNIIKNIDSNDKYNEYINYKIINDSFDNENYKEQINNFIKNLT
jgi:hypothetical protein